MRHSATDTPRPMRCDNLCSKSRIGGTIVLLRAIGAAGPTIPATATPRNQLPRPTELHFHGEKIQSSGAAGRRGCALGSTPSGRQDMNANHAMRNRRCNRRGLSVLEFVGCMLALLGGAWLGAIYLGVDLRHVAYVALSNSEMIDKVPEQWRPAAPAAPTSAELAQAVQTELASLRGEITALRSAHETRDPAAAGQVVTAVDAKEARIKHRTIEYWNRTQEIVHEQTALQKSAESAATEGNATKLAALKARINRFAASALRAVPVEDVDKAVVALSKELANWYDRAGDSFDKAVGIWESGTRTQGDAVTKEWEFAQMQLRNEGRLLGDKIAALRDSLSRRFNEQFAEISGP
jgi:hypothetical protein